MKKIAIILNILIVVSANAQRGQIAVMYSKSSNSSAITYTTLNPSDKSVNISLSGGNLTMSGTGAGTWGLVRSVAGKATGVSGILYCEATITTFGSNLNFGLSTSGESVTTYLGFGTDGYGYLENGFKQNNNSSTIYGTSFTTSTLSMLFNLSTRELTMYKDGVSQGVMYTVAAGTYYVTIGTQQTSVATMNFGASAWTYPGIPSGAGAVGWY